MIATRSAAHKSMGSQLCVTARRLVCTAVNPSTGRSISMGMLTVLTQKAQAAKNRAHQKDGNHQGRVLAGQHHHRDEIAPCRKGILEQDDEQKDRRKYPQLHDHDEETCRYAQLSMILLNRRECLAACQGLAPIQMGAHPIEPDREQRCHQKKPGGEEGHQDGQMPNQSQDEDQHADQDDAGAVAQTVDGGRRDIPLPLL
jgi:hypothetical protein